MCTYVPLNIATGVGLQVTVTHTSIVSKNRLTVGVQAPANLYLDLHACKVSGLGAMCVCFSVD